MNRSVLNRALLLAAILLVRPLLFGQQQTLPEAPQPVAPAPEPEQEPAPGDINPGSRSVVGIFHRGQRNNNRRPGFPPVSPPAPGGMRVPPAARPNVFGRSTECLPDSSTNAERVMSCKPNIDAFVRFLDTATPLPLTPRQKLILAARNVTDPFNLLTIGGLSAISVASDSHTADGPGFRGFAKNAGVSLSQDMTGEFFGTFLIPSLVHQDPHYHRMPNLPLHRRIVHVLDAVVVGQSDDGLPMFNYATVFGTICTNAMGNLYVPGRNNSFGSSTARIAISLATNPVGNAITEFVPDLARRVNFQVVIVQRLINRVAIVEGSQPQ
ncbi:MAG: hypothetical protein QOH35_2509 [Acidobacteriaceae bacterium]|nr:hypothetical protein [Acidobacteriaceae bacterium]